MWRTRLAVGITAVTAILGLTACPPPPPPPPPTLGGTPQFVGRQELRIFITDSAGHTVDCRLHLDTVMDLGYSTVLVNSKTSAVGCAYSAWTAKRAIGSCTIGTSTFSCGQLWGFNTSNAFLSTSRTFAFSRLPHFGKIATDFQANVNAGGTPIPISVRGFTPEIQCSVELQQCKFQT